MPIHYLYLIVAIIFETIGTSALQASQQFTRAGPTLVVILAYAISFYLLGLSLKYMPVGIVYAIWSGLGIVSITIIGLVVFGQRLDTPALIGLAMIIGGVLVIHLFSKSATH
ncbi:MAG: multidrug efflux SMR transporter [Pseudomonadota bacterium]